MTKIHKWLGVRIYRLFEEDLKSKFTQNSQTSKILRPKRIVVDLNVEKVECIGDLV